MQYELKKFIKHVKSNKIKVYSIKTEHNSIGEWLIINCTIDNEPKVIISCFGYHIILEKYISLSKLRDTTFKFIPNKDDIPLSHKTIENKIISYYRNTVKENRNSNSFHTKSKEPNKLEHYISSI